MSKDFHSSLARELEQFVAHMHALGYSYRRAAATLKSFDRYVLTHAGRQRTLPLASLLRGWLSRRGLKARHGRHGSGHLETVLSVPVPFRSGWFHSRA